MNLDENNIIKFEEIEKRIHSLSKNFSKINENLINLNNNLTNLQEYVENTETFNSFDIKNFDHGKKGYYYLSFDRIYFLCKKNCLTKLKITVNTNFFSPGTTYIATMYMMLNEVAIAKAFHSSTFEFSENTSHSFVYEHYFYPTKENNYINIRINLNSSDFNANLEITSINIEATGRNIMFLNRKNDFRVYISKNNYYMTKNTNDGGYYLKIPVNEVDLTLPFTKIPNLIPANVGTYNKRYYSYNHTYMPKISYNSATGKYEIDDSVDFFVFCVNTGSLVTSGTTDPPSDVASLVDWVNKGWVYEVGHPGNTDINPRNLAFVHTASTGTNRAGLTNSDPYNSSNVFIKLNGENISENFVSNVPVFAKDWEDNPNNPYMCIATNEFGENYFFNAREATYSVYLGKGIQTNAYFQSDGSINVYMRWLDKVYKKILIYNFSTSQYELSPNITEYNNTWEILEGYGTDYFICNNNGLWSYNS